MAQTYRHPNHGHVDLLTNSAQWGRVGEKVDEDIFIEAKHKIKQFVEEGLDNEIITKQEYEARCPESKQLSKFYCNFKVHKPHEH